jgi:uncharacterized protein (DUF1330 family)
VAAYIIVDLEITDPVNYEQYKKLAGGTVEKYGGKYIVRAAPVRRWRGDWQFNQVRSSHYQ